jgi:hypothetical protein
MNLIEVIQQINPAVSNKDPAYNSHLTVSANHPG